MPPTAALSGRCVAARSRDDRRPYQATVQRSTTIGSRPWSATSRHQASTAPGTVTASGECRSMRVTPAARSAASDTPAGVRPEPL